MDGQTIANLFGLGSTYKMMSRTFYYVFTGINEIEIEKVRQEETTERDDLSDFDDDNDDINKLDDNDINLEDFS